ncbi:hypothetical protein [Edwardsiella piscicida]|uniref:hypothetical protein n=1 Tax=Edwardsiella piscicida TaxID=1263550 RepID=UPI00370D8A5E
MTIHHPSLSPAGAQLDILRQQLLARKRVGKPGLPLHLLRDDQIKTRWTESELATIRAASSAMSSNPAVETNIAAIRGFLAMFAEAPEMLIHVHLALQSADISAPDWLPPLPASGRAPS